MAKPKKRPQPNPARENKAPKAEQSKDLVSAVQDAQIPESVKAEVIEAFRAGDMGRVVQSITSSSMYQGPIPPPDMLRDYEGVLPGSAERILRSMEQQSEHRQDLEKADTTSFILTRSRGQLIAGGLCLSAIIGGVVMASFGNPIAGSIMSAAVVLPVCGVSLLSPYLGRRS